jgi:hypothetical protein
VEFALKFFATLCQNQFISLDAIRPLIDDGKFLRQPPLISSASLRHLYDIMIAVNLKLGSICEIPEPCKQDQVSYAVKPGAEKLVGMEYLFQVLTSTLSDHVAFDAAAMLVRIYVKPYSDFGRCFPSWTSCATLSN